MHFCRFVFVKYKKGVVNIKYSIDKIKLEFQYIKTDRVQNFLNMLTYSDYVVHYESNKVTSCKHNFVFGDSGSIYIGIVPNWKKEDRYDKNIILEYNPNKVDPFMIDELSWLKTFPSYLINVMSIDFAVDMNIPYSELRMLKRDKREYMCSIGHSEVETRYLGELGHNHVKLYNKAKEQKLKGVDWSRFEITCKKINSLGCSLKEFECLNIPSIYSICNQLDFNYQQLNGITKIVFESIVQDVENLYLIESRTRKKYEKMLNEYLNAIIIDTREMYKVYVDYAQQFGRDLDKNSPIDFQALIEERSK